MHRSVATSAPRWLTGAPTMAHAHPPTPAQRRSVWQQLNGAFSDNPIGFCALLLGVIVAVFYGALHDAISNLNSAAGRIDTLAGSIGEIKGTLAGIQTQVAKIDTVNQSLLEMRNFNAAIDQQLRSLKSYEIRLIESFGVRADENLIVQIESGRVIVFPLTDQKKNQLAQADSFKQMSILLSQRLLGGKYPIVRCC